MNGNNLKFPLSGMTHDVHVHIFVTMYDVYTEFV